MPPTDTCEDCGADAALYSDVPLCFDCYLDRVDRVRACAVVCVSATGQFVVGAPSVDEAGAVGRAVVDELSEAGFGATVTRLASLTDALDFLDDYHASELARGVRSESRHVYAAASARRTVVDVETRTDDDCRKETADVLARHVLETSRIRKRDDVSDAVAETFPTLDEHRAPSRLCVPERVWSLAKEEGVSRRSNLAERNQRAGRRFEEFFRDWCDDRGLRVVRGKAGLVRHYPGTADEITRKTDGLAGVPDFLVRGDGQRSFGDSWRPDGDAFVEVKRGNGALSREQQTVVAHLKALGFDVYVLRGEPGDHRFERR